MRVTKGKDVGIGIFAVGTVVEDADERQGYFWMQRNPQRFTAPRPKPTNLCVPFAAIDYISHPGEYFEVVMLKIARHEVANLPRRVDIEPQLTVQEMVQSLPIARTGRHVARAPSAALPVSGTIIPATGGTPSTPNPFANLDLATQAQKIVAEASKTKLGIIEGMAKAEGMAQSENLSAALKEIMHQNVVADYQRLQAIDQYTDMEISRVLRDASQRSALAAIAGEDTHLAALDAEGRDH